MPQQQNTHKPDFLKDTIWADFLQLVLIIVIDTESEARHPVEKIYFYFNVSMNIK